MHIKLCLKMTIFALSLLHPRFSNFLGNVQSEASMVTKFDEVFSGYQPRLIAQEDFIEFLWNVPPVISSVTG